MPSATRGARFVFVVQGRVNIDEPNGSYPSMDYAASTLMFKPSWIEMGITWSNSHGYATSTLVYRSIQDGENRFEFTQAMVHRACQRPEFAHAQSV